MGLVDGRVTVEVPATSANLGPGYDCLGLALDLHDRLTAAVTDSGLTVRVGGEGADQVSRDAGHLVVRAMREAFAALGEHPPGLSLDCVNAIPHSRGLGSSSAAIVGGVVLARALVIGGTERLDDDDALALATRLEGHPDNVAPALLGGLAICGCSGGDVWAHRTVVAPGIGAVAFVPPHGLNTGQARGMLPDIVPHHEAAANTARAALLVAALAGAPEQLWRATEDFLHQRYRGPAMPESLDLVAALRADGVPAVVSGAGPTVLAFAGESAHLPAAEELVARCPETWRALSLAVEQRGARVR
ncbi:MAG: homoserine kinase [Marmoricola sp.]